MYCFLKISGKKNCGVDIMDQMKVMDIFGGEKHVGDEDLDTMPPLKEDASERELLDYMVLVLSRQMSCSCAFKGGYMLNRLLGGYSRMTHDIGFSVAKKGDYAGVKDILKKIAEKFKSMDYVANYSIKEEIQERMSGGIDFYAEDGHKVLGVDVGLHDISYGIEHYNLKFTDVDAFTVERMLSDKLIAITTRKRFRRTKDLYDLYAITNFFDVDMEKLANFVEMRGGAEWDIIPFNETVLTQYKIVWDKLELVNAETGAKMDKPPFDAALGRYYAISLSIKSGDILKKWRHELSDFS